MKALSLAFAFSLLFAAPALAQSLDLMVANCSKIGHSDKRLDCYDRVVDQDRAKRGLAPRHTSAAGEKWLLRTRVNPLDDTETVTVSLGAKRGASELGVVPRLVFVCESRRTKVYIGWGEFLPQEPDVTTRIGNSRSTSAEWLLSTDERATFHPNPAGFIRNLLRKDALVAQVSPKEQNRITAVFDVTGLRDALKPLRRECRW